MAEVLKKIEQHQAQNFQGANLQNRDFRGQNLSGADFSNADIRGANFSYAILIGANFRNVKAGLTNSQIIALVSFCIILLFFAGLISAYSGGLISYLFTDAEFVAKGSQFLGIIALVIYAISIAIIFYQGMVSKYIILAVAVVTSFVTVMASGDGITAVSMKLAILGLAGANAGFASIAVAVVIAKIMALPKVKVLTVFIPLLGAVVGSLLGIKLEEDFPVTTLISLSAIAFGFYIGNDAVSESSKHKMTRYVAVDSITARGTKFYGANLTNTDFTEASLKSTDLRKATLNRACFFKVKQINYARVEGTYLENAKVRKLVITKTGNGENFDELDLHGVNLKDANLEYATFISTNLSFATLENANLSGTKLGQAQLYKTCLKEACLTGAYIENWGISTDTELEGIKCDYIYMRLPTEQNPDPWRKPDNREEIFREGDFADFIAPIIKTLDLYQKQKVDMRQVAKNYKTLDLFHYDGIDPNAAIIALKQLTENHPEAGLEIVALEGRGQDKIRVQAKIKSDVDGSELDREYFDIYSEIKSLPSTNLQELLLKIADRYKIVHKMLDNGNNQFYIQINQTEGDFIMSENQVSMNNETYKSKYDQRNANIGGFVDTAQSGSNVAFNQNINAAESQKNLAEAAAEIQDLLEQLSKSYPTNTISNKMKLVAEATRQIENNPNLTQKVISALQVGSTAALEQLLNHPLASFLIAALEDLQNNK
ncbi:MAG: pentapeptide repeat-containing protein [Scytonematopsis contorta HA4267-MV1]|jgi:uncharacterized protein YjbI with pentapeptide repeats|nr:pentapeptide repeat-containing protein [Scytonematopsis contorta HA4267-MV1]